jgi:hypothetical protein
MYIYIYREREREICAYWVLVGKPDGKRSLEKPRRRWKDNIKMDLRAVGWGMDWLDIIQDRDRWRAVVNAVMKRRVSENAGNFFSS